MPERNQDRELRRYSGRFAAVAMGFFVDLLETAFCVIGILTPAGCGAAGFLLMPVVGRGGIR